MWLVAWDLSTVPKSSFPKSHLSVSPAQDDGLQLTRGWLQRHAPPDEELSAMAEAPAPADAARFLRLRVQRVLNDAFLELLEWDDDQAGPNEMVKHH